MAIGAEIFAQFGQRPKSIGEYRQELDAQDANALALKANTLNYQNALQAAQDDAAYRETAKGFGADTTANYNALLKASPKAAMAYQKSVLDAQKTQADIEQSKASAGKSRADTQQTFMKTFESKVALPLKILESSASPQQVLQATQQAVQSGIWTLEQAQQNLSDMPSDPAQFTQWRQGELTKGMAIKEQIELKIREAAQAETARHNRTTEGLTASGQRQQMTIAQMTDARQRELGAATRDVAAATREEKAATKKAEADDKAVTKFANELQKEGVPDVEAALSAAESVFSKYKDPKTGKLRDMPGIGKVENALPDFAVSSEGKDVRESLAAVSNIVLSARSGAAVTDQELRRLARELSNSIGSSEEDMLRAYGKFRTRFEAVKANLAAGASDDVKKAYEERGGIKIQRGGAKPVDAPGGDPVADALKKYGG